MSEPIDDTVERDDAEATPVEELSDEGVGATTTDEPTTFEPEEPEEA